MATWVQHVLSADGWETAPALASARPSSLAVPRPLLQRGTQVSTVKAEGDPIEDIWQALKKGKRPGTDPGQCNPNGRLTTEASLCMWLTGLSDGEKYGLISQAVSDAPLCLEGLEAVLQLGWYDMNTYIQTSTGMFSPAALVLCNHGGGSESSGSAVVGALRMLLDAGADLKRPAVLSFELDPLRERARRAGVLDRLRDSPPGARERAQNGSASAKKELQAIHKHNHQVVDRAEVAAHPERLELDCRRKADASSHRKRFLAL